ncbi:MAG: ATPase [Proteobacteria bacterium]|nr:MAG: ATPase [Pseudomonadota bacterium]
MIHWLPNRIMQGAAFVCAGASIALFWLVLSQPWLGMTLAVTPEGRMVGIVAIDPDGPARGVPVPSDLVALEPVGEPARRIDLTATDLLEEPDVLDTYEMARRFMQRQTALALLLRLDQVMLRVQSGDRATEVVVTPSRRPLGDLPSSFWVQFITGAGSLLLGAWVLALRPRDLPTRLFAVAGAMILVSAYSAAVYSSRELAIDGAVIRAMSALNHIGALGFGVAMISLFLLYPRRLVQPRVLLILPVMTVLWLTADILQLPQYQALGAQLPVLIYMVALVVAIAVQWFVNRNDPRGRAALRWLGLSVIVGAGAFVVLIIAPILVDASPAMKQGHAFGFFLLIYAGLALGVSRYRLFDLDEWSFRVMFYTAGVVLLLAIDAVLIYVVHLQHGVSFSISLLAVAFIYLPARDMLRRWLQAHNRIESHELFRAVVDVTFASSAQERSERWRDLLQRLFDPLVVKPLDDAVTETEIGQEGLEVRLPAVADTPALLLRYPWRGQRLFSSQHRDLAQELVRLMSYVEHSRDAYERGSVEERRRIARDLHDDVGARLLSGLYKTDVADTHRVLRDALADIRTIVSGLSSDQLPLAQIVATLRHETGERLAAAGIELSWPLSGADENTELLDYRIYRGLVSAHREVVSNIIRHAQARRVEIIVVCGGEVLTIRIADDGIGIDLARTPEGGSGLRGMIRRLNDLGGSFSLVPAPSGCVVEIRIPLAIGGPAAPAMPHVQGVPEGRPQAYSQPADAARQVFDRS